MPDHPSAVSGAFRKPFREQVAFFRQKLSNLVPTQRWDDLLGEAHDTAFMVAGAAKADLLADLAAAVDRAISEGKSLDAFRRDFDAAVDRHGWHGWTGEDSKGGRAWRTRTIYRTNTRVAYAAGRRAQLEVGNFKYWVYRHGGSRDPRPEHINVFNGLALPPDHPFWDKFYPPSDWGCSCYVVGARSIAGVRRLGGDPDKKLPDGWDRIDPKTGEPAGIGKGWGYAPGASVAQTVNAMAGKVRHWDYRIAKAFMEELPEQVADLLADSYRRLPSIADDARNYARRVLDARRDSPASIEPVRTLGPLPTVQRDRIVQLKPDLAIKGFDLSLTPDAIRHVQARHGVGAERSSGQDPVTIDDYAMLLRVVSAPDRIEDAGISDVGEPIVRFSRVIGDRRYVAVFAIRRGRKTIGLKTFYIQRLGG